MYVSLLFYLKLNNSVNNVKSNCGVRERRDPRQQIIYVSTSKSTLHFHVLCVEADILRRQKRSTHRATRKVPKRNENKFLKPPSASVRGHRSREILILKTRVKLANIEKCYKHKALISHNSTLLEEELFVLFVTVFLERCEDEEGE